MAVSGRPLGAIWAVYLFAPNIKAATWENGAPEAFIEINCACGGAKHGGEWEPSRRNLGSLFVCSKQKAATWENGRGA